MTDKYMAMYYIDEEVMDFVDNFNKKKYGESSISLKENISEPVIVDSKFVDDNEIRQKKQELEELELTIKNKASELANLTNEKSQVVDALEALDKLFNYLNRPRTFNGELK